MFGIPESDEQLDFNLIVGGKSPPGTSIIGYWDYTSIRIYTDSISNTHALFLVTVHELFHALGFGSNAFRDLTTDALVYTGSRVDSCVSGRTVYTDTLVQHWRNNHHPFHDDVQEPILPLDGSASVSRCTASAIIDMHPTWTGYACDSDSDCPTNHTCAGKQRNLAGICVHLNSALLVPRKALGRPTRTSQFPSLTAFIVSILIMYGILAQCVAGKHHVPVGYALRVSRRN